LELLRREFDEAIGVSGLPSSIRSVTAGTLPAIGVFEDASGITLLADMPGAPVRSGTSDFRANVGGPASHRATKRMAQLQLGFGQELASGPLCLEQLRNGL
jgi:hypothetical protein